VIVPVVRKKGREGRKEGEGRVGESKQARARAGEEEGREGKGAAALKSQVQAEALFRL
jgi:hypothetical protein